MPGILFGAPTETSHGIRRKASALDTCYSSIEYDTYFSSAKFPTVIAKLKTKQITVRARYRVIDPSLKVPGSPS